MTHLRGMPQHQERATATEERLRVALAERDRRIAALEVERDTYLEQLLRQRRTVLALAAGEEPLG